MAPQRQDPLENFYSHVWMVDDGCWFWTGATRYEYGVFSVKVKGSKQTTDPAHVWAYERLVGPVPEGLVLDHLCRKTLCVNPKHLEPVTVQENVLRGTAPSAVNAKKTHCIRGHELSGDNLYIHIRKNKFRDQTHRLCKTCQRERNARCRARKSNAVS